MSLDLLSQAHRLIEPLSNELGLHWAQNDAQKALIGDMNDGHRRLYADMAMGSGKTAIELSYLEACFRAGVGIRGMIWTNGADDVRNILENEAPLWAPELYKSGQLTAFRPSKASEATPFGVGTYSGVSTAIKNNSLKLPHVAFADEAQNALSDLRSGLLRGLGNDIIIPALTATPAYSLKKNLDTAGYKRSYHLPFEVAVANSLLSSYRNIVLEIDDPDKEIDDIDMVKGDLDENQIERLMRRRHVMDSVMDYIDTWVDPNTGQTFFDRKGMFSCVSIPHAVYVAEQMNKRFSGMLPKGMNFCEPIWSTSKFVGSMSRSDRDDVIDRHRNRQTLFLATKDLLLTGHNDREIDTMFNLRPTASMVLVPQRGGRPVRYNPENPDKEAHIIDTVLESDRARQRIFADYAGSGFMETAEKKKRRQGSEHRKDREKKESIDKKAPIESVPYKVYYDMSEVRSFIVTKERREAIASRPWLAKVMPSLLDPLINSDITTEDALVKAVGRFAVSMGWDEEADKSRGKGGRLSKSAILKALRGGFVAERNKENGEHHKTVSSKWRGATRRLERAQAEQDYAKIDTIKTEIQLLEEDLRLPLRHTYALAEVAVSTVLGSHAARLFSDIKTPESKTQIFQKANDGVTYIPEGVRGVRSLPLGQNSYTPDHLFAQDATVANDMASIDHTQANFADMFADAIAESFSEADTEDGTPILAGLNEEGREHLVREVIAELLATKSVDGQSEAMSHRDQNNVKRYLQRDMAKGSEVDALPEILDDYWLRLSDEETITDLDDPVVREINEVGFAFPGKGGQSHGHFVSGSHNDVVADVASSELSTVMTRVLQSLTPREERVLRSRFGIGVEEQTLEEVGQSFSVTRARISQMEAKAIRKLKHPSRSARLRQFL